VRQAASKDRLDLHGDCSNFPSRISTFHEQYDEISALNQAGPWPFSAFVGAKWAQLDSGEWALFIDSRFFPIIYDKLTPKPDGGHDQYVILDELPALAELLSFISCENWATVSERFPKDALTSAILAAILRIVPESCDGLAILSSLIKLTDVREVVPDAVWFLFRALASAPFEGFFEGFCGDLQALAADLERPHDDLEWFCGERPLSFLRDFLVRLAFCPDVSVLPPVFFHFLVLLSTGHPDSHFLFCSTGVWEFLGTRLLQSTTPTLPRASLPLLARCAEASEGSFPFAPKRFLDCLGWDTCPAAVTVAVLFIDRECPGWE
jgi:hypothetical protein